MQTIECVREAAALPLDDIVPLADRLATRPTWESVEAFCEWWEDQPPHWPAFAMGWDLRRLYGDAASGWYVDIATERDDASVADARAEWASFDRPQGPGDALLIDALDEAHTLGLTLPETDAQALAGLRAIAATRRQAALETILAPGTPMPSNVLPYVPPSPEPARKLVLSDSEFIAGFESPAYVLDGVLQRRWCYALTAQTGAGKTAIALRLAAHIGLGRPLAGRDVAQGTVLYFASENSVDVQARWIAMADVMGFEAGATNVHFVAGVTRLSDVAQAITAEVEALGKDLALVVVDTSAATFEGDDENSNVHAIEHAKRMRSLTTLRGGPTVLVLCHPTKRAREDDLIPRGGGAFLAEIDGNLCARKDGATVELHWTGKFRGMDFAPIGFELRTVTAARLRDRRGRPMPTVVADPLSEARRAVIASTDRSDEDAVLRAIEAHPGASSGDLAKALGWRMGTGEPYKSKVLRTIDRIGAAGLVVKHRRNYVLTPKGEKELNRLDSDRSKLAPGTPIPTPPGA